MTMFNVDEINNDPDVKKLESFFQALFETFELRITDRGTKFEVAVESSFLDKKEKRPFSYWAHTFRGIYRENTREVKKQAKLANPTDIELVKEFFLINVEDLNRRQLAHEFVPYIDLAIAERLVEEGEALRVKLDTSINEKAGYELTIQELNRKIEPLESEKAKWESRLDDIKKDLDKCHEESKHMFSVCPECGFKEDTLQSDVESEDRSSWRKDLR